MRTVKEAYLIIKNSIKGTDLKISGCLETDNSWIFQLLLGDTGAFIPPAQVYKDEHIEPDFYKGDLFNDCTDGIIHAKKIPLESIV